MLQRSFSIVEDDDDLLDNILEDSSKKDGKKYSFDKAQSSESDDSSNNSPKKRGGPDRPASLKIKPPEGLPRHRLQSAGPSNRTTLNLLDKNHSDSDDSENEDKTSKIPGEYDPTMFERLDVDEDIKEVFQYIIKYTPQHLTLDWRFKPFVPDFLPAVGDIDAFLKVLPPETTLSGEKFDESSLKLGLAVLDEPAFNQSDPALLHLQLRAASDAPSSAEHIRDVVIKKVDNLEKNGKTIEKWIKDISHLHRSKSSAFVRYPESMPDIDDLLQEWTEEKERQLQNDGFPKPNGKPLQEYIQNVCQYLGIPMTKNRTYSLHLLFSLYAAMKQTQLYQVNSNLKKPSESISTNETDQLVLD